MIITGALFAEKIDADREGVHINGGDPHRYTIPYSDNPNATVSVPVLLFVAPDVDDVGEERDLKARILDTDGDVVGTGPFVAAPDYRTGSTIAIAHIDTQFAREWHYFLYVGNQKVAGFDAYYGNPPL